MIILFSFISTTPEIIFKCVSFELILEKISDKFSGIFISPRIFIVPLVKVETIEIKKRINPHLTTRVVSLFEEAAHLSKISKSGPN